MTDWFESWFDTPHYHKLYSNRSYVEADNFIQRLVKELDLAKGSKVLDWACGSGRHSISLSNMGFNVTGVDLSEKSIATANESASKDLEFFVHDIRDVFDKTDYDLVLNLFTSFGYFQSKEENTQVLRNIKSALKVNGQVIIDFLNPDYVRSGLVAEETVQREDQLFFINRHINEGWVIKNIKFELDGELLEYEERVRLIEKAMFLEMFNEVGFECKNFWGDYELNEWSPESPRQIFQLQLC